ncbi:unnamed protein product [Urochloa decumbens]|uniref:F-box domain-containing protein n=1 Tax=Urochloa decumbens TaxID=240449 RepID=A0ABC9H0Y6_9POAL
MPALSEHLIEEILIRIPTPRDLVRASAACASFRRFVAAASFLRCYRSLHPPPLLLGVLGPRGFLPAEAPHPNALVASVLARDADFSTGHLPPRGRSGWLPCDARDGRVFLISSDPAAGSVLPELAACDPLTRGYALLPPIPDSVVASVLDPAGLNPSNSWPSYAYGCFYWKGLRSNKLLKLDANRMEFSAVGLPPNHENGQVVVAEAGEGRIGILRYFLHQEIPSLCYSIMQNEGEDANEHLMETTIPLPSDYHRYFIVGAAEGYIFLEGLRYIDQQGTGRPCARSSAFFSLEIKTLKIERVCSAPGGCVAILPYFGFLPFLSPRRI